jgi:hypothetical protein
MLLFVYWQPFSGSPNPCPSPSLSTAASVHARRVRLLPTLATRGAGNTLKSALADMTHARSDTITMNAEHVQSAILAVSSALTASNEGEEISEVRERREQQRGEERNSECGSGEIKRQVSPRAQGPIIFN